MTWKQLLANRQVRRHRTSKTEVDDLRKVVARDLHDASLPDLSADRRFATAYNAVLQLSKMATACAGYRVSVGAGHHQVTFHAARLALGPDSERSLQYFDVCRRKRNAIDYDAAECATETEAAELLERAGEFRKIGRASCRERV